MSSNHPYVVRRKATDHTNAPVERAPTPDHKVVEPTEMDEKVARGIHMGYRVAAGKGLRTSWERARTKCESYLRGHTLAEEVGLAPPEPDIVCDCTHRGVDGLPHLHVFGSVIAITHLDTSHDTAMRVAKTHTFHHRGTSRVFRCKSHDYRDRSCRRANDSVVYATTLADALHQAWKIWNSDKTSRRAKRRIAGILGTEGDLRTMPQIWKKAKARRVGKKRQRRRRRIYKSK